MTRLEKRIRAKFSKIQALRESGNHKQVKQMSDTWQRRGGTDIKGFYDKRKEVG